jgi:DNA-binding LytR/AlgR family response regulator
MKKNIRILIVEDEFITLDLLRSYIEEIGYEVSGDAMRAEEAIEILEQRDTDIALLDINIKGNQNGIWIAEQICKKYHIPFIFTTAYNDPHTIQNAIKTHPSGYLIKPFNKDDIFAAIEVALQNYAHTSPPSVPASKIDTDATDLLINQSIFIKEGLTFKKINIVDIHYIESCKNYLELHLANQKIVVRATLQKFYDFLPKNDFIQIHRSFIVNIRFVDKIRIDTISIGANEIPLGKNYKDDFYMKLQFLV